MADGTSKCVVLGKDQVADWLLAAAERSLELTSGAVVLEALVPPEIAQAILRHMNASNPRSEMRSVAARYGRDMQNKMWWDSYAPLVFEGDDFDLVDGQHRLRGVVDSGVPTRFLVVIYASGDAKRGIDVGKIRSITATHGLQAYVGAAGRIILHLESGDLRAATRDEVSRKVAEYSGLVEHASAQSRRRRCSARASFAAAFAVALRNSEEPNRSLIEELLDDIVSMNQSTEAARGIVALLERDAVQGSLQLRCDEALKILVGIVGHLDGTPRQILRPTTRGLRWFLPLSKYRSESSSPELSGAMANRKSR